MSRPIVYEYEDTKGVLRPLAWGAALDAVVGLEFAVLASPTTDLPVIRVPEPDSLVTIGGVVYAKPTSAVWLVHPDWLEPLAPPALVCTCDALTVLMVVGCKCGVWAAQRKAR